MLNRIWTLIKGFFGLFIGGLEKNNPEALLEAEKESLRKQISEFNVGLANHAGMVEKLMSTHKQLAAQEIELKRKVTALINAGQNEAAAAMALRYKQVDEHEDQVRGQLEQAEVRYKELVRARDVAVKAAKDKIEKLTLGLNDMKIQKAMADMNEMAASMVGSIGGSGDTLNRLEELVENERTKAAGRARVARDSVDMSGLAMVEGEQKAMESMALADFAAANGITLPNATPAKDDFLDSGAAGLAPVSSGLMGQPLAQ